MGGRKWKKSEIQYLEECCDRLPTSTIARSLGRAESAVLIKASRMGISCYKYSTYQLSTHAISQMLDIECSTVRLWHRNGLKYMKKAGMQMHNQEELAKWMRTHQDMWDATRGDMCLVNQCRWFQEKYQRDKEKKAAQRNQNKNWNEYDARELYRLKNKGWTYKELAEKYSRSQLSCKLKYWDMFEKLGGKRMKKWEDYKTMDEAIDDYIEYMAAYGKKLNRTEARKEITKKIPLEPKYQEKIVKYLNSLPECIKAWKESKGTYSSKNGTPDIIAVMNPGGVYFGFEVKRPIVGVISDLQQKFIDDMNAAGGHAYVVVTKYDVKRILIQEGIIHENK